MTHDRPVICLGIDPGKKGAVALIDENEEIVYFTKTNRPVIYDAPVIDKNISPNLINKIIGEIRRQFNNEYLIIGCLEQVATMPSDGHSGAFTFGRGYGYWEMAMICHGIRFFNPRPTKWQTEIFGRTIGKNKDSSRAVAIKRWPNIAEMFHAKSDDGRSDACHLGVFGIRSEFKTLIKSKAA